MSELIAAGYILRHVSLASFFVGLPALLAIGGLAFAAVVLRSSGPDQLEVGLAS